MLYNWVTQPPSNFTDFFKIMSGWQIPVETSTWDFMLISCSSVYLSVYFQVLRIYIGFGNFTVVVFTSLYILVAWECELLNSLHDELKLDRYTPSGVDWIHDTQYKLHNNWIHKIKRVNYWLITSNWYNCMEFEWKDLRK